MTELTRQDIENFRRAFKQAMLDSSANDIDDFCNLALSALEGAAEARVKVLEEALPVAALLTIENTIKDWIDRDKQVRASEGLATAPDTAIMTIPCSMWPGHGQLQNWVDLFANARAALDADRHSAEGWEPLLGQSR